MTPDQFAADPYGGMPDPGPKTREQRLENALAFFGSCIRSGEAWDDICQRAYDDAMRPDARAPSGLAGRQQTTEQGSVYSGSEKVAAAARNAARDDRAYAIEHAGYLADAAETLLEAANALHEDADITETATYEKIESYSEHAGSLRNCVYEFRKRADRAAANLPALPDERCPNISNAVAVDVEVAAAIERLSHAHLFFAAPDIINDIRTVCAAASRAVGPPQAATGIYVASRVSRAPMWRELRAAGCPIISTWIDEAGDDETDDFGELWERIESEIKRSRGLIFYGDIRDQPWKGAMVEVGIALALGKPIAAVVIGELDSRTMRPIGSWLHSRQVTRCATLDEAIRMYDAAEAAPGARDV